MLLGRRIGVSRGEDPFQEIFWPGKFFGEIGWESLFGILARSPIGKFEYVRDNEGVGLV
jgi:hypothetical protein